MQWAFVNMLYQKTYKTDIFNESASSNRKLIFNYFFSVVYFLEFRWPLDK